MLLGWQGSCNAGQERPVLGAATGGDRRLTGVASAGPVSPGAEHQILPPPLRCLSSRVLSGASAAFLEATPVTLPSAEHTSHRLQAPGSPTGLPGSGCSLLGALGQARVTVANPPEGVQCCGHSQGLLVQVAPWTDVCGGEQEGLPLLWQSLSQGFGVPIPSLFRCTAIQPASSVQPCHQAQQQQTGRARGSCLQGGT